MFPQLLYQLGIKDRLDHKPEMFFKNLSATVSGGYSLVTPFFTVPANHVLYVERIHSEALNFFEPGGKIQTHEIMLAHSKTNGVFGKIAGGRFPNNSIMNQVTVESPIMIPPLYTIFARMETGADPSNSLSLDLNLFGFFLPRLNFEFNYDTYSQY